MLYKCANEACSVPFRRLREGKLFQVEREFFEEKWPPTAASRRARPCRKIEHFWLCDTCSPFVTLTFDRDRGGVVTMPLPNGSGRKTVRELSLVLPENDAGDVKLSQDSVHEVLK